MFIVLSQCAQTYEPVYNETLNQQCIEEHAWEDPDNCDNYYEHLKPAAIALSSMGFITSLLLMWSAVISFRLRDLSA